MEHCTLIQRSLLRLCDFLAVKTASAYCLELTEYLKILSKRRRKNIRAKLNNAAKFIIKPEIMADISRAWNWSNARWEAHGEENKCNIEALLSWFEILDFSERASGQGITSAVQNPTYPQMKEFRYNLGTPGLWNDFPYKHSGYKLDIMPRSIRLTQLAVFSKTLERDVKLMLGYKSTR